MQYFKFGNIFVVTVLGLGLSACAELTDGLSSINGTLAGINSGMGASSNLSKISVPDKVTSQYEIRNLTISQETISDLTSVHFNGQAYNKTKKNLRISIKVPVYDSQGFHTGDVRAEVNISPNEKTRIDTSDPYSLNLAKGEKMNTSKVTYRVDVF